MNQSIGNGYPIGIVVTRREIGEKIKDSLKFRDLLLSKNPLGCAMSIEALKVIEEERLVDNSRIRGAQLKCGLKKLKEK